MIVSFKHRGHDVSVRAPARSLYGKYTITIGNLVKASPTIRRIGKTSKIRIFWDKDYGSRFNGLLQSSLSQYFRETQEAA
jgi:hypothetical protein